MFCSACTSRTRGSFFSDGKPVKIQNPHTANDLGIGMVHQHFMLVKNFTVLENIILGAETVRGGRLRMDEARAKVLSLSERYNMKVDLDAIRAANHPTTTAVIVTNADDLPKLHIIAGGIVSTGTPLFKFE